MRFLHRTAELTFHRKLLRKSSSREVALAPYKHASWLAPARPVSDTFDWSKPLWLAQDLLKRFSLIVDLGTSSDPQEDPGPGDNDVWNKTFLFCY